MRRNVDSQFRAVVGALVFVLVAAGCSDPATKSSRRPNERSTTSESSRGSTTQPPSGSTDSVAPRAPAGAAPTVGACLEPMTYGVASAARLPELVSCDGPHGGEIVAVYTTSAATYPAVASDLSGVDQERNRCLGSGAETGEFDEFAGDNRLQSPAYGSAKAGLHPAWLVSSLEGTVFVPGPAAWGRGERWVVCAAVLKASTRSLSTYEGSAKGRRTPDQLTEEFAWCRTGADDSGRFDVVGCSEPHNQEQVASFSIDGDGASYPGEEQLDALAGDLCPGLARAATDGRYERDTESFGLSWTYPVAGNWADGDRVGRCLLTSLSGPTTGWFGGPTAN